MDPDMTRHQLRSFRLYIPGQRYDVLRISEGPRFTRSAATQLFSFIAGCYNLRNLDLGAVLTGWNIPPTAILPKLTTLVYKVDSWRQALALVPCNWSTHFPNLKHATMLLTGISDLCVILREEHPDGGLVQSTAFSLLSQAILRR